MVESVTQTSAVPHTAVLDGSLVSWIDGFHSLDSYFYFPCLISLLVGLMILFTQRWHLVHSSGDLSGVQIVHKRTTPRIGGLAVFAALMIASIWSFEWVSQPASLAQENQQLRTLLLASIPAFLFGFFEDISSRVGILPRLLATMLSAGLAWSMTGELLTSVNIPVLDSLLQSAPLGLLFTVVSVAGVANSLNIVDGFNGIASGTAFFAFLCFAVIGWRVDDSSVVLVCLTVAGSILGFLVINWPWGKLFLGDGGSYLLGFLLGWVAVMIKARHPQVSAFALYMILAYPLTEMLFTVFRRLVRRSHPGMPDRLHFHSLLKARYVNRWFSSRGCTARNSLVGLLIVLIGIMGQLMGLLSLFSVFWSALLCVIIISIYLMLYARMVLRRWVSPLRVIVR